MEPTAHEPNPNAASGPEADRLRKELETKLTALFEHCWRGWLYVREWRVLDKCLSEHPVLRRTDPALFNLAHAAFADQSMLTLARLVDKRKDVASVHWVIDFAERHKCIFRYRTDSLVAGIAHDKRILAELEPRIGNLKKLRDNYYAHLNRESLTSLDRLFAASPFGHDDAEELFRAIGGILNRYSGHLLDAETLVDEVIGEGHTKWLLDFLGKSLTAANLGFDQATELQQMLNELFGDRHGALEITVRSKLG